MNYPGPASGSAEFPDPCPFIDFSSFPAGVTQVTIILEREGNRTSSTELWVSPTPRGLSITSGYLGNSSPSQSTPIWSAFLAL